MGYIECLVIAILAFIVIGPKDFPKVMFKLGDAWRRLCFLKRSLTEQLETLSEKSVSERKYGPKKE